MQYLIAHIVEAGSPKHAMSKFRCREFETSHPLHEKAIPLKDLHILPEELNTEPFECSDRDIQHMLYLMGFKDTLT